VAVFHSVVSWEQTRPDGTKTQRFGTNPKGVSNVFTVDGRFFLRRAKARGADTRKLQKSSLTRS
jgi:hypothetical protein